MNVDTLISLRSCNAKITRSVCGRDIRGARYIKTNLAGRY